MAKDQSMNDEDWNAWTEEIRTWYQDVDTHVDKSNCSVNEED